MERILFVDDEKMIINSLKRGLMDEEFEKFYATSAEEALKILEEEDEICVMVTDMKMPNTNGLELLMTVKDKYPHIVKIVLSGYTMLPQVIATINKGDIFKFVTKPWDLEEELIPILREALDYYNFKKMIRESQVVMETKNRTYQNILKTYDKKLDVIVADIRLLEQVNRDLFSIIRNTVLESNQGDLAKIESLLNRVNGIMPIKMEKFKLAKLGSELESFVQKNQLKFAFDVGIDGKLSDTYRGKIALMKLAAKDILKNMIHNYPKNTVNLVITGSVHENNKMELVLLFKTEEQYFKDTVIAQPYTKMIKSLATSSGGTFSIKSQQGNSTLCISGSFLIAD